MNLTQTEKTAFVIRLKAQIHEACQAELELSRGQLSYLGICKLTGMIEREFVQRVGDFPKSVEGACKIAESFHNPDQVKSKSDLQHGLALLIGVAGRLNIILGLMSVFNIWTIAAIVLALHMPLLGPLAFAGSIVACVAGYIRR